MRREEEGREEQKEVEDRVTNRETGCVASACQVMMRGRRGGVRGD